MRTKLILPIVISSLAALVLALAAVGSFSSGTASAIPVITFDGSPGTAAPPTTLGPFTMIPFANDARPLGNIVADVPDPAGTLTFNPSLTHVKIGSGWATWSHGYTGDVYHTSGTTVTLKMPPSTAAFYFYAEPNVFATFNIAATADDGTTSGPIAVAGFAGAKYFGFYGTGGANIATIEVTVPSSASGFAVGEFGIASKPPTPTPTDTPTDTPTPTITPTPTPIKPGDVPLGGGGVFPDVPGTGGSGVDSSVLAGIFAAVTVGALGLGGAAWYTRRRLGA